jgi:hypothetical protein
MNAIPTTYVNLFRLIILLIPMFFAVSCEKETKWELQESNIQTLVVDGILTNELKPQCIKLSLINNQINQPVKILSGAIVTVSDGSAVYSFAESTHLAGNYFSTPFQAVAGKSYRLKIDYQAHQFEATAAMAPLTTHAAIAYSYDDQKQLYKYEPESSGNPVMSEVLTDWSHNAEYATKYGSNKAKQLFYVLHNVDASKIFAPARETIYFPAGTKIVRQLYSLTAQHQAFLRSLLMETEWRGGVFDVQPGNVALNISNGGLGFFGVCMTQTDSTVVK